MGPLTQYFDLYLLPQCTVPSFVPTTNPYLLGPFSKCSATQAVFRLSCRGL
jgi:hypothetical protein